MEELGGGLVGIAHGDEVDVVAGEEAGIGIGVFVDADGRESPGLGISWCSSSSEGISSRQGAHQVAQKLSSTTLPR